MTFVCRTWMLSGSARFSLCVALMLAVETGIAAENPPSARGRAAAVNVDTGPAVDGKMKDPIWQKCPPLTLGHCTADRPLKYSAWARVLFDGEFVYVGVHCEEPDTVGLVVKASRRDGSVWQDDSVEVFVQTDPNMPTYQFVVNPAGVLYDSQDQEAGWDGSAQVKASVEKGKGWTVTLKAPMKEFNALAGSGKTWRMNINRTRPARGDDPFMEYSWAVMRSNNYHSPEDFGLVTGVRVVKGAEAPAPGSAQATRRIGDRYLILDESSYWSYYLYGGPVRISPEALRTEGDQLLGPEGMKRLERTTLAKLKKAGKKTDDWRNEVYYSTGYPNLKLLNEVDTSFPPPDWMKPQFDDRDWSCYRKPFMMGKEFSLDGFIDHTFNIKTVFFRGNFEIPDPAAAGDLQLHLVCRGGMRAFLNGEEIGRCGLPGGDLTPDVMALPYATGAYCALKGEHPGLTQKQKNQAVKTDGAFFPECQIMYNMPTTFDTLAPAKQAPYRQLYTGYGRHRQVTRQGWDRITGLRNRTLDIPIPTAKLRKGTNVLAVEVHTSEMSPLSLRWAISWGPSFTWKHGWLMNVQLSAKSESVPATFQRPAGVQVWPVEVNHRLYAQEFLPVGRRAGSLRIVGARNGVYAGQIAVGTDRPLGELKVTVSDLTGPGGAKLPASVAKVLHAVPRPEIELRMMGEGKGESTPAPTRGNFEVTLNRFALDPHIVEPTEDRALRAARKVQQKTESRRIQFFDQLSTRPQGAVPPDRCRAIWLSVKVPADARPGLYRGKVMVHAEGMKPAELPLELAVADWRVPDPPDFQTIVALEQSPYGVARHYKVKPWSDKHFALMERSFELLAEVANDFLAIPVVCRTEFGNDQDCPIRTTRKADGTLLFDFSVVDRYLDLAIKHWGAPRCICFGVDHCVATTHRQQIKVTDEATGREELLKLGVDAPPDQRRQGWRALATAIYAHMKSRGLEKNTYWGLHGDGVDDPTLPPLLKEFVPDVTWARFSHQYRCDDTYTFCSNVRGAWYLSTKSLKGWKEQYAGHPGWIMCWLPRHWNTIATAEGKSAPFAFRLGIERALCSGAPGLARGGADYWAQTWCYRLGSWPYAGNPIAALFWPGPDGAESSARFEMLREGIQETEARIFLEQALEKLKDPALEREITSMLDKRIHDTIFALTFVPHVKIEEYSSGWQTRSRALHDAAARVQGLLGVDCARNVRVETVPVRGKVKVAMRLRNYGPEPRAWKVSTANDWIRPEQSEGTCRPGSQPLMLTLDGAKLKPGEAAQGVVNLTDVRSGRTDAVKITANVTEVFRFTGPDTVANVIGGRPTELDFTLLNRSGADLKWTSGVTLPWLKVAPPRGKLPAGAQCAVAVEIAPTDNRSADHSATLTIEEAGGAKEERTLTVHVLPEYPLPRARPIGTDAAMEGLHKDLFQSHGALGAKPPAGGKYPPFPFYSDATKAKWRYGLKVGYKGQGRKAKPLKEFKRGFSLKPGHELVYRIEGKNLKAFAVEVGWMVGWTRPRQRKEDLLCKIFVDGNLRAHSGFMAFDDPPRLLVVEGLRTAREVRFVTRSRNDRPNPRGNETTAVWGDPVFYRQ